MDYNFCKLTKNSHNLEANRGHKYTAMKAEGSVVVRLNFWWIIYMLGLVDSFSDKCLAFL